VATHLLHVAALVGTGVVAGVFFAVAVSVLPALRALPPDRYVQAHQLLGRGYHPSMPLIVTASLGCDIALALLAPTPARQALYVGAALLLIGVQVVSQFGNVPINKVVNRVDPDDLPADWHDPRPRWRDWHLIRTAFAFAAMVLTSAGSVLPR